ncbi:hypothetical protein [Streptomyces sp. NBC_01262]|uniref:hypothetical protein n=1 Tax=Streptomyces sp. NBC_01262 TaxID=2903803 RepID=UPI002E357B62|nr:hypothetical protein [Streptomyces sp. NBC_01262]
MTICDPPVPHVTGLGGGATVRRPGPSSASTLSVVPSYAKDRRCIAMAEAIVPLLRRSCPEGAGGYGGSYQVNLDDEEAVGLGGVELIRAAMRKAARTLGWKVNSIGMIGTKFGTMVVIQDVREIPEEHAAVVTKDMNERVRAALHPARGEPGEAPVQQDTVALMTQEFRAAVAAVTD